LQEFHAPTFGVGSRVDAERQSTEIDTEAAPTNFRGFFR